ncbi:aminodeoxychorismate synthase component 1 [Vibrio sp. S9_S30]|uniref:aminodeoxychorismate synthase component 1 n=1 Tax=Vibrio sp. S9_S30 TaxID=2720226 RepID=UPI0016819C91|nr:aminodeoxychorismate synthase component 1 [Vibrio sp. S9_S30]MBD1558355.1 aminodeoxychorismate synthase component 1 [Vibrio sp. S9_S30]
MNNKSIKTLSSVSIEYSPSLASDLFSKIESRPWSMLLRSASESHPDSRFDILVANPVATIITSGDSTTVDQGHRSFVSKDDPFQLLDALQSECLPKVQPMDDLPFVGGALGYFSYDLGRRVEAIPVHAEKDINSPDMAVGIYEWALICDHQLKKATLIGTSAQSQWEWLSNLAEVQKLDEFSLITRWRSNLSKNDYVTRFNQVQDYLQAGDCYQINLAQRFSASYKGSEWLAYVRLEEQNKAPFSAFIRMENSTIISVSPERFLQLKNGVIETKPIKGTRPRSDDPKQDEAQAQSLQLAEKDQAENLMIVDLLRNDIGRVAKPGTVAVPTLFSIESFPAVHHLVSTVTAELAEDKSATDLLRACFPGGSITGAPKVRAMEIIEELEPHRRNAYCGSIGYISRCGRMDTSITIRTLVAENQTLYAWAGGGLVADSEANSEYQETFDKLSRILPILG